MINPCPNSSAASATSCPPGKVEAMGDTHGSLGASTSLGLAYGAIYATPPIFNEVIQPTRGRMLTIALIAFGAATVLYLVVGICGCAPSPRMIHRPPPLRAPWLHPCTPG